MAQQVRDMGYYIGEDGVVNVTSTEQLFNPGGVQTQIRNTSTDIIVYYSASAGVTTDSPELRPGERMPVSNAIYLKTETSPATVKWVQIEKR